MGGSEGVRHKEFSGTGNTNILNVSVSGDRTIDNSCADEQGMNAAIRKTVLKIFMAMPLYRAKISQEKQMVPTQADAGMQNMQM
jgi:hypothetical protein